MRPSRLEAVPQETARVARAAFPRGALAMRVRDELGQIFEDSQFSHLFARRGRPALAPWRLALVSVLQFAEGLSDRQAADAVRARIDWKYALALELDDRGFDFSVLCEFRARLLNGGEDLILDVLLGRLREAGLLVAGGRQRTDSTHVLAAVRTVNRLELVGETLRCALHALALSAPDWLAERLPDGWGSRYGHRVEEYQLSKDDAERLAFAEQVGADGALLLALLGVDTPARAAGLEEIDLLRQVWAQHYKSDEDGAPRWVPTRQLPPSGERIASPYDPQARYALKRGAGWSGYKTHLTETCEPDRPHLIVATSTTPAQVADNDMTLPIHGALERRALLPDVQLIDPGYTGAELLIEARRRFGVELFGPAREDSSWQAKTPGAFDVTRFAIDWDNQCMTCPNGAVSINWSPWRAANGDPAIHVEFSKKDCTPCPDRARCTRAAREPRQLTLHEREAHDALTRARCDQKTETWKQAYAARAGVEGTISQAVRGFGIRTARYQGLAKTHLQNVLTATAINLTRVNAWLLGTPIAGTRPNRLAALQRAAAV